MPDRYWVDGKITGINQSAYKLIEKELGNNFKSFQYDPASRELSLDCESSGDTDGICNVIASAIPPGGGGEIEIFYEATTERSVIYFAPGRWEMCLYRKPENPFLFLPETEHPAALRQFAVSMKRRVIESTTVVIFARSKREAKSKALLMEPCSWDVEDTKCLTVKVTEIQGGE